MKRIYIVVEGQTEQEFVRSVMAHYFFTKGVVSVTPILIRTSKTGRGGHVSAKHLLKTIAGLLATVKNDVLVTTFVDFFRIPNNMPDFEQSMSLPNDTLRVKSLEDALARKVNDPRFIPYIQLHEFEALLFSNNKGFEDYFSEEQSAQTAEIISAFANPEDINSSLETAPSKRILALERGYDKVLQGNLIAMDVGMDDMLAKCPRFSLWVSHLIEFSAN